jgi:hypothetical protein
MLSKVHVRFYLKTEDDWEAALIYPENIVEITVDKDFFGKEKTQKERGNKIKKFMDLLDKATLLQKVVLQTLD